MRKTDRTPQRSGDPLASQPVPRSGRELEIGLADLGLSEREARLYVAMLSKPDSTSIELHRMANISRKKIYEALTRMIERKLCVERQVGRAKRYTPVDPELLVGTRTQQMTAQLSEIQRLKGELCRLYETRDSTTVPLEYLEVLRTPRQIKERITYLVEKCHSELLVFSKLPYTLLSDEEADRETLRSLKRIKDVRSIYEFEVALRPNWKEIKENITRWRKAGEKSRFVHRLPTKLLVLDGLHVLLLMHDEIGPGREARVLFSNRELAVAFRTLFESVWDEAVPYERFMAHYKEIVKGHLRRHA